MKYSKDQLIGFLNHYGFQEIHDQSTPKFDCYKLKGFLVYVPVNSEDISNNLINDMFFQFAGYMDTPVEEILGVFERAGKTLH